MRHEELIFPGDQEFDDEYDEFYDSPKEVPVDDDSYRRSLVEAIDDLLLFF